MGCGIERDIDLCAAEPQTNLARQVPVAQAASLSFLLTEPIAAASISVPLRTVAPFDARSRAAANRLQSSPFATSRRRKRTKAVRSGVTSSRAKPPKRRKLPSENSAYGILSARSESASASIASERSYQVASSSALNIERGGQAFSPLGAGWSPAKDDPLRAIRFVRCATRRRDRAPGAIDQSGKRVEDCLPLGLGTEPKDFLPDPPLRHETRSISMGEPESSTASHFKHPHAVAHRSHFT